MTLKGNILLVGASGKKGHGKDALLNLVMKQVLHITRDQVKTVRIAFGDPLKDEVAEYCGPLFAGAMLGKGTNTPLLFPATGEETARVIRELLDHPVRKMQFRKMLQWWGTEYRRDTFGEDYWVDRVTDKINEYVSLFPDDTPIIVMVPDCRFPNEAAFIRDAMGYLYRVNNPNITFDPNEHPSETMLDTFHGFDAVIINDYPVQGSAQYPADTHAYREALAESKRRLDSVAFHAALDMLEQKWGIKR